MDGLLLPDDVGMHEGNLDVVGWKEGDKVEPSVKVDAALVEAELEVVDKLLVSRPTMPIVGGHARMLTRGPMQAASELPDDDADVDAGGVIAVPGAVKAVGLLPYDCPLQVKFASP